MPNPEGSTDSSTPDEDIISTDATDATEADAAAGSEETPTITGSRVDDYKSGRPFDSFALSEETLKGLAEMGYTEATSVQAATIEPGIAGKDLIVRAKTGTGKTTAFGLPIIERIEEGARVPQAIVLSPTRELANQIARELEKIAKYKDIRLLAIYGGVAMGPQEDALEEGVELIVGTPGRVLDHIRRGNLDLSQAKVTCLDEADEMLSMGFFKEVTSILKQAPKTAQTLLFSATVEADVKRIVSKFLKDPVDIMLSTDTDRVEGITHVLYETDTGFHKARALMALIDQEKPGSTVVFCNTREDTSTVATFLDRQGLDCQLISGELPQKKREAVMARVKSGEVQFLVATDVAARGIDISNLSHVINYSLPQDPAVYMHRVGRTGRIGKKGTAITLAGGSDMSTRVVLEKQFEIQFVYKDLPTADEANALRVERQAERLTEAKGLTAFEGFLGLARALKERDDGDVLMAVALRNFFLWDREQRAKRSGVDSVGALSEARAEKRARESERGGGGRRRSGGRDGGRDGGRGGRDGGRGGRDGRRGGRDSGSRGPRDDTRAAAPRSDSSSGGEAAPKKRRRRRRRSTSGSSDS